MPPTAFTDPWQKASTTTNGHSGLSEAVVFDIDHRDDDDAALARRIQQELDDEELAKRLQGDLAAADANNNATNSNNNDSRRGSSSHQRLEQALPPRSDHETGSSIRPLPPPPSIIVRGTPVTDEDVARKLQQEMHDEILAHQLTAQESQRHQQRGIAAAAAAQPSVARRFCSCIATTIIVAAVAVTLFLVFGGGKGLNLVGLTPDFAQNDPYNNNSTVIPWRTNGHNGLKLEVVNALDTKWYTQFQKAVNQWDSGTPDALTLSTSESSPDSNCDHITGKLKVCNGNYGDTQWLGINEQLVQSGYMVASAARMNDFYLDGAAESQKQYTMCHEIGHGFGLPHTDENFYNKDLGNCLDYTVHPWVNQQPAAMNFNLLNETYGTVGSRRGLANPSAVIQQIHPEWVLPAFTKEVRRLREVGHEHAQDLGWTVLHKSEFAQIQTRHLGEGYMAHVYIMFAVHVFLGE